ncbi:hypothetical protein FZEAL_10956 [Fusarium zealandicum]|uniref:Uncharacterized protein n=1 Tax=Fusarium zealandicum TaxID=1053134 RepID=A0A8H4X5W0_9HYPO|nr:hypothetical protein FZEAL_10956 [Fusarium zealandicum]
MTASPLKPFSYDVIHNHPFPYQWANIIFLPSNGVGFAYMNNCYITILAAIPIFLFFGMTKDAMNSYRRALLYIGLGHIFPKLHEEYDPDRDAYGSSSGNSRLMSSTASTSPPPSKFRSFLSSRHTNMSTSSAESSHHVPIQSISLALATPDVEQGHNPYEYQVPQTFLRDTSYPPLTAPSTATINTTTDPISLPDRNPFLFRTRLDLPTIPLPSLPSFSFKKKKKDQRPQLERGLQLNSLSSVVHDPQWDVDLPAAPSRIQTRVWSEDDEIRLYAPITPETGSLIPSLSEHAVTVETLLTRETHRR